MVSDLPKELSTLLDRLYGDVSSKLIENAAGVSEKCKIVVTGESNSVFGNTESVTIVTIPGEDKIISKQFMESVADSSVLIYVINSACPDDVQENKLMQLCKQLQSDTRLNNLNSFDAKCIMFVCNNWEIVEKKESSDPGAEKKIWKEVVTKIKKYFPGISEHDQIYKLRTNEASE
ncbi:hypothetical protein DPMN_155548 [Dreissena polymorpha]|nr:hypothetical protein DPMN_155548 [Dreissena polymorpha]